MPSDYRLSDFQRWFRRLGVIITSGKGSHFIMTRTHEGVSYSYAVPTIRGRYVKHPYLDRARRALKLDVDSGVDDKSFFG